MVYQSQNLQSIKPLYTNQPLKGSNLRHKYSFESHHAQLDVKVRVLVEIPLFSLSLIPFLCVLLLLIKNVQNHKQGLLLLCLIMLVLTSRSQTPAGNAHAEVLPQLYQETEPLDLHSHAEHGNEKG